MLFYSRETDKMLANFCDNWFDKKKNIRDYCVLSESVFLVSRYFV